RKQVGFGQRVGKEIARLQLDTADEPGSLDVFPRDFDNRGQVEDRGTQFWISAARRHGQVTGRAAKVHHAADSRQLKRPYDLRRGELPVPVHAGDEVAFGLLGAEEMAE